ncbi:MAG: NB-ARC domain-containing protein [Elainellaceae cyanobacterium]
MSRSLRVKADYIQKVKHAVKQADFASQTALARKAGLARATVNKFLNGRPVDFLNFTELCALLGFSWEEIASPSEAAVVEETAHGHQRFRDWGDAPAIRLHGHSAEKGRLEAWLLSGDCRVIAVTGLARVRKTFLVAEVARRIANSFELVIWRTVQAHKTARELLIDLIGLIDPQQIADEVENETCITLLVEALKRRRCLIVLNRMEQIMQPGEGLGAFESGYEICGEILRRIGEQEHQSCLIVISREPFRDLTTYIGDNRATRQLPVKGLSLEEARFVLKRQNISGALEKQDELIRRYGAHPTFIQDAAGYIKQLYQGNVESFLSHERAPIVISGIKAQLDKVFSRLSETEKETITWIALFQAPCSEADLKASIQAFPEKLRSALWALKRRSLVDVWPDGRYQIHDYIREYLLFIVQESMIEEIQTQNISFLQRYPLVMAQAEDAIRARQSRSLLEPMFSALKRYYGNARQLEEQLERLLNTLRQGFRRQPGYAAANLLSLFKLVALDLRPDERPVFKQYDFSELTIKQADLRGIRLRDVNFSYADLDQSLFYELFGGILSIALSQDGRLLAAGDASHNVYVWRLQDTRFELHRAYQGHTHWVRTVTIGPTGRYLASGSEDNTVRVWDLASGETIAVLRGYDRRIRSLVFSPDEQHLASASDDSSVVLWSTRTWRRVGTHTGSFRERRFREVLFDPTGSALIAANQTGKIYVWAVGADPGLQNPRLLTCDDALVRTIAIHPDGHILASGGDDGIVKLWAFTTGQFLGALPGKTNWIRKIVFSQDGNYLASSSEDGKIQVWNIMAREQTHCFEDHTGRVWEIAFGPDSKTLISGSDDQQIKLWHLETQQCLTSLQGYTCKLRAVAFSPEGHWVASGGDDQIIRIWDVHSGLCVNQLSGHKGRIWAVVFYQSASGDLCLVSGSDDRTVKYWNIGTGQCIKTFKQHTSWVRAVSAVFDHPWIVSGGDDKSVRAFNLETFESKDFLPHHQDWILSVALTPDGKWAISGSDDGTAVLWNVETGEPVNVFREHASAVKAVAVSPDGQWVATGGKDKTVKLSALGGAAAASTSPLLLQIWKGHAEHSGWVRCVAFHPSLPILASGGYDQKAILWNFETGETIQVLRGHDEAVISVAFSRSGDILATGSEDETVRLWDMATGKLIKTIRIPRPYEGLDITGALGISREQRTKLLELGAVERLLR